MVLFVAECRVMDVLTGHDFRSFPAVFLNGVDLI
jgi:hypothetical protein